jgi:hypothetical protein
MEYMESKMQDFYESGNSAYQEIMNELEQVKAQRDDYLKVLEFYACRHSWISLNDIGIGGIKMAAILNSDRVTDYENSAGHFLATGGKCAVEVIAKHAKNIKSPHSAT